MKVGLPYIGCSQLVEMRWAGHHNSLVRLDANRGDLQLWHFGDRVERRIRQRVRPAALGEMKGNEQRVETHGRRETRRERCPPAARAQIDEVPFADAVA